MRGEGACRLLGFLSRSSSPATLSSELVRSLGCAITQTHTRRHTHFLRTAGVTIVLLFFGDNAEMLTFGGSGGGICSV